MSVQQCLDAFHHERKKCVGLWHQGLRSGPDASLSSSNSVFHFRFAIEERLPIRASQKVYTIFIEFPKKDVIFSCFKIFFSNKVIVNRLFDWQARRIAEYSHTIEWKLYPRPLRLIVQLQLASDRTDTKPASVFFLNWLGYFLGNIPFWPAERISVVG